MAGWKLEVDLGQSKLFKIAKRVATEEGFHVVEIDDYHFEAKRGSLPLSIFFGAWVAYCDFKVEVEAFDDATDLALTRNNPWWTGLIGISRCKSWAKHLVDEIAKEVEEQEGAILDKQEVK